MKPRRMKNPGHGADCAVRGIKAQQVIAMTGTPVENRLMEFWSILSTVQPKLLGSMKEFADVFARPIEADHDERAAEAFRRLTAPFMLRRVKPISPSLPICPKRTPSIISLRCISNKLCFIKKRLIECLSKSWRPKNRRKTTHLPDGWRAEAVFLNSLRA